MQQTTGRGTVRHIPRAALHLIAATAATLKPALARQARAALAMDTIDMSFDPAATRHAFPSCPRPAYGQPSKSSTEAPFPGNGTNHTGKRADVNDTRPPYGGHIHRR